jgi:hypothetical protein
MELERTGSRHFFVWHLSISGVLAFLATGKGAVENGIGDDSTHAAVVVQGTGREDFLISHLTSLYHSKTNPFWCL